MINIDWGLILTIVGVLLGIAPLWIPWQMSRNRYVFSWKKVSDSVKSIHEQLRLKAFEPDVIVAFAKGGFIIADLVSRGFSKDVPICSIPTRRILQDGQRTVELDTTYMNPNGLAGKRVLVVDDIVQTGASLQKVVEFLCNRQNLPKTNVVTVALGIPKGVALFQPDIFVFKIEYGEKRPRFPWGEITLD